MDPVPVQICPVTPHRSEHLIHIRIIYKACDHFLRICKTHGNTAVIIPKHKVRRTVNWIDQEAQPAKFFLPGIPFCLLLAEEGRLRYNTVQLVDQKSLDRHIIRSNKICSSFFVLYRIRRQMRLLYHHARTAHSLFDCLVVDFDIYFHLTFLPFRR